MSAELYAAEAVLPGHPDKLCDAIADALVEEAVRRHQRALCRVDVAVHRRTVLVAGRIACPDADTLDVPAVVRQVYASAGYGPEWGPAPEELRIEQDLNLGPLSESTAERRAVADDQAIVIGYAVDLPGTNYLPPEQWLVQRLMRRLERLRGEAPELRLGPDGKLIVLLEEEELPRRLAGFSGWLQQAAEGPPAGLQRAVRRVLTDELANLSRLVPGFDPRLPEGIVVNAAGNPAVGGPEGGSGLSGRKLVVDAYGPRVPLGGGSLGGKDFYQVDRAGAVIARRLARAAVQTGTARECQVTLAFVPGQQEGQIIALRADGRLLDVSRWAPLLDRSLGGTGDRYSGAVPLVDLARYGHFTDEERPWERLSFDG
jgi:S-adenosylmethionine synthetase